MSDQRPSAGRGVARTGYLSSLLHPDRVFRLTRGSRYDNAIPALVPTERVRTANGWIALATVGVFLLLAFRQSATVPGTLGSTWALLIVMFTGLAWLLLRFFDRYAPHMADGAYLTALFFVSASFLATGWGLGQGLPHGAVALNMDLVTIRDLFMVLYFGFLLSNLVSLAAAELMIAGIVVSISLSSFYALVNIALGIDLAAMIVPPLTRGGGRSLADSLLREGMVRPAGAAGHPLELSFLVTLAFPLALSLVFSASARRRPVWPWLLCCAVLGAALLSGLSRAAIIGSAAALVAMAMFWSRRRMGSVAVGLFLGALGVLTARPELLSTLINVFVRSDTDDSLASRGRALAYSANMIAQSPLLGCGNGCLVEPFHPVLDNQFLGRLIEAGLLGLLSFVLLLAAPTYQAMKAAKRFDRTRSAPEAIAHELSIGLVGSMVSVLVINLVLDTTGFVQAWQTMWVLMALCWTMRRLAAVTYGEAHGKTLTEVRQLDGERDAPPGAGKSGA